MSQYDLPVQEMMGNTMNGYGYTIVNTDLAKISKEKTANILSELNQVEGMIRVRLLNNPTQGEWL